MLVGPGPSHLLDELRVLERIAGMDFERDALGLYAEFNQ